MLKIDKGISDHQTWEDFSEKGLCEDIKNLQDYRLKFSKNAINLRVYLQNKTSPITSPNDIKKCHGILFNGIYPWAGTYRKSGIFCRSRDGAPIDNIQDELELLQEQIEILLKEAPSLAQLGEDSSHPSLINAGVTTIFSKSFTQLLYFLRFHYLIYPRA